MCFIYTLLNFISKYRALYKRTYFTEIFSLRSKIKETIAHHTKRKSVSQGTAS